VSELKKLTLDGSLLTSESMFDDEVEKQLDPSVYGRNLNALWDVLTAVIDPPISVEWFNAEQSKAVLGERFDLWLSVFEEARDEYSSHEYRFEIRMGE
jgi:ribonuclease inhibitor